MENRNRIPIYFAKIFVVPSCFGSIGAKAPLPAKKPRTRLAAHHPSPARLVIASLRSL